MDFYSLKTNTYEQIVKQDREQFEKVTEIKQEKTQMYHRRKNYATYVKQVHIPTVSKKKSMEMQTLISGTKHPVKNAVKISPGANVSKGSFFFKRQSQSQGYIRNPNAYLETQLPNINPRDISESQNGNQKFENPESQMNINRLYKSSSYHNVRSSYVSNIRSQNSNKREGNLGHLDQWDEDRKRIVRQKPPAKDYLSELRSQRLAKEKNTSAQEKISLVMTNTKLSKLEKLQRIREETGTLERKAIDKDRQQHNQQSGENDQTAEEFNRRFDNVDQANGMLLDAIKAKLAILDEENEN